jgi:hypothetical protein
MGLSRYLIATAVCSVCILKPYVINVDLKQLDKKVKLEKLLKTKPDITSQRESIDSYYRYDKKTKRWLWGVE